jgi:hypothetical protein
MDKTSGACTDIVKVKERHGQSSATGTIALLGVLDAVELDLLLADLAADRLLLGDGLLAESHPLDRNGLGVHDRALRVQSDLVLLLGDRRAVKGAADVGVGDGLAL